MPGVAQPRGRDRAEVDLADHERLLELRGTRDDGSVLVDGHAAAVEDQLVLAADEVAEDDRGEVVPSALDQHLLALRRLSGMVGGGGQVDDHLRAGDRLGAGRRAGLPDVLADGQPDGNVVQLDERGLGARLEVAVLVEYAVVRQEHLPVHGGHPAIGQDRGRVVDVVGALREADQRHDPVGGLGEAVERTARGAQEVRLQQQVLRRVPGEPELGEYHEPGALAARVVDRRRDLLGVAVDVSDGGVELRHGQAQRLGAHRHRFQYAMLPAWGARCGSRRARWSV